MGAAGEAYARWLLARSYLFAAITRKRSLGRAVTSTGSVADLLAHYKLDIYGIGDLLVEVKNTREVYDYSSGIFYDIIQKAIESCAMPLLVSAFIGERGRGFCEALGIGWLVLNKWSSGMRGRFAFLRLGTRAWRHFS